MGEKIGFMTVLLLFGVFIVPFLLLGFIGQVESSKFLTIANEVQQLVSAEGGDTEKVHSVVSDLEEKGVFIEFSDVEGQPMNDKVDAGEEVIINYNFKDFNTKNSVTVLKRKGVSKRNEIFNRKRHAYL